MSYLPTTRRGWRSSAMWLSLGAVVACYLALSTRSITLPGLYFDAINPDYIATKILHPEIPNTVWTLPGNLLLDRFPVLHGSFYNGSLQAYLSVPLTYLFGPSVATLRLSYICEAALIILAVFICVYRIGGSVMLALLGALPLAVDPAFVFAFRTQAYVVTFPIFFTLLGFLLLTDQQRRFSRTLAGGILIGFSAWGYFVHFFFIPGILLFLLTQRDGTYLLKFRNILAFAMGLAIGSLPYFVGYMLILDSFDSLRSGVMWIISEVTDLKVVTPEPLWDRIDSTLTFAQVAMTGEWFWEFVWGIWHRDYGQIAKLCLLIVAPCIGFGISVRGSRLASAARLILYAILSFMVVATMFGGRMGGHHFVLLLPPAYVLMALSAGMVLERGTNRALFAGIACIGSALFVANLSGSLWTLRQLRTVEGADFYSNTVSDYPIDAMASGDRTPHIFMDWGGLLQFTYLTDGRIPAYDLADATQWGQLPLTEKICAFGITKLVFLGEDSAKRGRDEVDRLGLTLLNTKILSAQPGNFEYSVFTVGAPRAVCDGAAHTAGQPDPMHSDQAPTK